MSILENIKEPNDIKKIETQDLPKLAEEIRECLLENVSRTGGHLASNLGCVELTIALHRIVDLPKDKIVWDVGHQSYIHKILTGRKDELSGLRQLNGISGFPKRVESPCDVFNTGHSSTSMSAALGMACARDIRGTDEKVIAVIGDGSFTGGMVYEAMNNMANMKTGCLVVLNDNEMSIDKNVGGMSKYLNDIRVGKSYNILKSNVEKTLLGIPALGKPLAKGIKRSKDSLKHILVPGGMFFEDLGITYIGPVDGHDIETMEDTFRSALQLNRPVIVHVRTTKGKGYKYAEKYPSYFHGVEPFDIETGKMLDEKAISYTGVFGRKLVELGSANDKLVAITAAMSKGTGISKFAEAFPDRTFDVGIAEEHAVTFAAGLAVSGLIPVVAIYSSFLQRAYDQILHDVCMQNLHVIFAIDRSGLVGSDGETHQGIFDTAYLSHVPNLTILAPKNRYELTKAMEWAVAHDGPVAIKYSRGEAYYGLKNIQTPIEYGRSEYIYKGSDIAVIAVGNMVVTAEELYNHFLDDDREITVVNARFIKPLDTVMIDELAREHKLIVVLEEGIKHGGYGAMVEEYIAEKQYEIKVHTVAIEDTFVQHGKVSELRKLLNIDCESVYQRIKAMMNI